MRRKVRGPVPAEERDIDGSWYYRYWWLTDWRGATLRRATEAEAIAFDAARAQDRALSSRAKVKAVVR